MWLGLLGERQEVVRVAASQLLGLARRLKPLARVLADRLQHREPLVGVAQEALVDERLEGVEIDLRHLLGRLERGAAPEDGEPGEEGLLRGCQQLVAPVDGCAEGALAFGQISGAAGQKRQALLEPLEDLPGRECLHARGGQLEREGQLVEAATDLRDGLVGPEVGLDRPCSGQEEADALLVDEGRHRVLLLAPDVQRPPARHEHVEVGTGGEQAGDVGGRRDDLLEVVEEQEHRSIGDVVGETVLGPERLARRLEHQLRVTQRGKRYPPHPALERVRSAAGRLECQARLARPARPGKGDETNVLAAEERADLGELQLTAQERRGRDRQVRLVEALQRREVGVSELVDAFGRGEVLEAVYAEVA